MTTQNTLTISQPAFATTMAITQGSEKDKSNVGLAHLASVLQSLKEMVANAKAGISSDDPQSEIEKYQQQYNAQSGQAQANENDQDGAISSSH